MADLDNRDDSQALLNSEPEAETAGSDEEQRLELTVNVESRGTCQRHVTVTIAQEDIQRFFDKEYSELMPTAQVPGFRPGRAPRKLVEARFRKTVAEKVKGELLMQSISQINEEQKLSAISEPEFDMEAVVVPEEGPLCFEFDIEVRPEFDLPNWKGMLIERPVREFSDADIDQTLQSVLARRGRLAPLDGPAAVGDYITTNLTVKDGDQVLASAAEEVIRIRPVLSFRDGKIEGFDKLMVGVRGGETREGQVEISADAPNEAVRGRKLTAVFEVLEVKRLELPELTPGLLEELGNFEDEADLRDGIRDQLQRQLEYEQRNRAREQITNALTVAASWDLPPSLLQRQSHRELQRAKLELQSSGFSEEEIQARENFLRQNIMTSTARALKEHFILERIAEEEKIDATDADYDEEIRSIAAAMGESARRVRAKLEKSGSMDILRNQIIERKVIALILEHAKFKEVPYEFRQPEEAAVDLAAASTVESEIPEAKYDEGEPVPEARTEGRGERGEGRE